MKEEKCIGCGNDRVMHYLQEDQLHKEMVENMDAVKKLSILGMCCECYESNTAQRIMDLSVDDKPLEATK